MSVLSNVNYMKKFVAFPCATPNPIVIVETAFEVGAPLLMEFFSFQLAQLVKAPLRDMGRKNAPPSVPGFDRRDRRRESSRGHGRHIRPDAPADRVSYGEKWGPNTILFRMHDATSRALLYWLIADLATEFMARWTTMIYKKQNCPTGSECYKTGTFNTIYIGKGQNDAFLPLLSAGGTHSGGFEIVQDTSPETGLTTGAGSFAVETELRQFHSNNPPTGASVQIVESATGDVVAQSPDTGGTELNGGYYTGATYTRPKGSVGKSYKVRLKNDKPDETVAIAKGVLHLSGGFCVSTAPALPFDANHLVPRPRAGR